ncbi:dipeptidylpeptidase [Coemansia brasiliensis]|uniref:Dipeptidyl-peptidase V n=1 Tax=Coemansia brasiliensis TaxID=2650707 RepID=A0A9W8I8N8_9FUNG|nr:dipeptidylpeptidase [Coemansia brasiliensis]
MTILPGRVLRALPAAAFVLGALARPFTPEDLVETTRLSGNVAVSPDGTSIAYKQTRYSIDKKRQFSKLLVHSLDDHEQASAPMVITEFSHDVRPSPPTGSGEEESSGSSRRMDASEPVWLSSDTLGFITTDAKSHTSTLYSVRTSGKHKSKPHAVFTAPVPISDVQYNEKSGILAFTAQVYKNSSLEETAKLDAKEQERADTAMVYDELWVRHWDTFVTDKLPQIHTLKLVSKSHKFKPHGMPQNIIRNTEGRLEASSSFVFSPNGRQVAFVAKRPGTDYAWRTTSYVYVADVDGSVAVPINPDGGGASASPTFSADGSRIAYLQMNAPAYEADRNQIKVYNVKDKSTVDVAADWDRSPSELLWADDNTLLATYNEYGRNKLAKVDIATGTLTPLVSDHSIGSMQQMPAQNEIMVSYSAFDLPTDLYRVSIEDGQMTRITRMNPQLGTDVYLSPSEDVEFTGADDDTIHGFILHPPNFDPEQKYPLAYVIHGGPQSSFTDSWSTRWNLNIFAAAGFVTVAMDFQGSTGYGQNFTDAIRNQWGGKPFESLMLSLEQLLDSHPYIDQNRLTALGASYGGYQINWINAHTTAFKALVNHDGMFSTISTYYSTDELYFPETEFEGVPFDKEARENYERWSPERNVRNWKTPTLVIHSEKDYRLVVSEGLSTFTALRRQGVPARFLYYPDENHWVLKPANSLRWHHEVLSWITRWTRQPNSDSTADSHANFIIQQ